MDNTERELIQAVADGLVGVSDTVRKWYPSASGQDLAREVIGYSRRLSDLCIANDGTTTRRRMLDFRGAEIKGIIEVSDGFDDIAELTFTRDRGWIVRFVQDGDFSAKDLFVIADKLNALNMQNKEKPNAS